MLESHPDFQRWNWREPAGSRLIRSVVPEINGSGASSKRSKARKPTRKTIGFASVGVNAIRGYDGESPCGIHTVNALGLREGHAGCFQGWRKALLCGV